MCGISAIFAYRSSAEAARREELEQITERMRPRGPDASGTWFSPDGRVALGSRRLSIIDLSDEGTQPMFDAEGSLGIVFNGEIYNYQELRTSLRRSGTHFHSQTDTEVLLHLYRRDGEAMLGLLRGMYAFAIWDARARRMFIARDPYGIKPLYFADDGGTIRLASTVKALLAGGAISPALDTAGVAGFFLTGSVPEPFTIHRSIQPVLAGTSFHVVDGSGRTDVHRHYSIVDVFRHAGPQRSLAHLMKPETFLHERVRESVEHHLVADVPVAILLSAGVDSSALALTAGKLANKPLQTFTLTFDALRGKRGDEAPEAERFARQIGSRHTTRVVSREEFQADLPKIFDAMDQPTIDGVNTWFVSKAVHEAGLKVALSGLGGDELLGSYPSFRNVPRIVKLGRIPLFARAAGGVSRHPKARFVAGLSGNFAGAYLLQRGLFLPAELPSIIGPEIAREGLERLAALDLINATITPDPGTDFGRVATLEASLYLRNQLLRDADWASMAHSVEVRTPLVDSALLRQLAPLLLEKRSACKAALASMLSRRTQRRRKTGFVVPIRDWTNLPSDATSTGMRAWAKCVFEHCVRAD